MLLDSAIVLGISCPFEWLSRENLGIMQFHFSVKQTKNELASLDQYQLLLIFLFISKCMLESFIKSYNIQDDKAELSDCHM